MHCTLRVPYRTVPYHIKTLVRVKLRVVESLHREGRSRLFGGFVRKALFFLGDELGRLRSARVAPHQEVLLGLGGYTCLAHQPLSPDSLCRICLELNDLIYMVFKLKGKLQVASFFDLLLHQHPAVSPLMSIFVCIAVYHSTIWEGA